MHSDPSEYSQLPLIILLAVVIATALWAVAKHAPSAKDGAAAFSSLATGIGIVVAGYWFLAQRKIAPHVGLTQTLVIVPGDPGYAVVESSLNIANLGETLLPIRKLDLRLQTVDPSGMDLAQVRATAFADWPAHFADGVTPMFVEAELQWPTIRYFARPVVHDVEPGETDVITSTFVVSCATRRVRVAAEVAREGKKPMAWKTRAFGSTIEACDKPRRRT